MFMKKFLSLSLCLFLFSINSFAQQSPQIINRPITFSNTVKVAGTGDIYLEENAEIIGTNVIGADVLKSGSVTSAKLVDGTIATDDVADNAITTAKIANDQITSAKILGLTIVGSDISDLTIDSGKLAANCIVSSKITDGTIGTADLGDSIITSAKIADSTIGDADIGSGVIGIDKINDASSYSVVASPAVNVPYTLSSTKTVDAVVTIRRSGSTLNIPDYVSIRISGTEVGRIDMPYVSTDQDYFFSIPVPKNQTLTIVPINDSTTRISINTLWYCTRY